MRMKPCPRCGNLLEFDDDFCGKCGSVLEEGAEDTLPHEVPVELAPPPAEDLDAAAAGFDDLLSELTGAFAVMQAAHVLFEGVEREQPVDATALTRLSAVLAVRPQANTERSSELTSEERLVLSFVDGNRSVARVERKTGLSSEEVKRAIGTLGERGFLELRGELKPDLRGMLDVGDLDESGEFNIPRPAPEPAPPRPRQAPAVGLHGSDLAALADLDLDQTGEASIVAPPVDEPAPVVFAADDRPPTPERATPRFVGNRAVIVKAGREALGELWMSNLSKGGLFVETDAPPPLYTPVNIMLETPDGSLSLTGDVVHVQLAGGAGPAGFGIQLTQLNADVRGRLTDYVNGLAPLAAAPARNPEDAARLERALQAARALSNGNDANDLVGALGLGPDASSEDAAERVSVLRALFEGPHPTATPPQSARCANAIKLLAAVADRVSVMRLAPGPAKQAPVASVKAPAARSAAPTAAAAPAAPQDPKRMRAMQLLEQALGELRAGKRSAALTYIRMAAEMAPGDPQIEKLLAAWTGKS